MARPPITPSGAGGEEAAGWNWQQLTKRGAARNVIDRAANNREKWRPATGQSYPTTR